MRPIFLYGPLCDDDLRRALIGDVAAEAAVLPNCALRVCYDGGWPVVRDAPEDRIEGLRVELAGAKNARFKAYIEAMGAGRLQLLPLADGRPVYLRFRSGTGEGPWALDRWQEVNGALERGVAAEAMAAGDIPDADALAFRLPTIRQRVASRLRAEASPAPVTLRFGAGRGQVRATERRYPYMHFFAVEEADLAHPRFAGGMSAELNRAALVGGDTVAVLPYDPGRDRVLMVEQFRFGAFARGDPHPWVLEPVAGRIDPGETPEAAAHRETAEEAGLTLERLLPVCAAYPSPGQMTEFLHVYVGIAALPDSAAGLGGLEAENEDIRAHVVSFERMMALVASGEIGSMPLALAAFWLDRARREGSVA